MQDRRMFSKSIIYQDQLTGLSHTALALYIYLNLEADDEGFVANPRMVVHMAMAEPKHLQDLIEKGYLIAFSSGPVVITHWKVHNSIRNDRIKKTRFVKERKCLTLTEDDIYERIDDNMASECRQCADTQATQDKIIEDNSNKVNQSKVKLIEDKIDDTYPSSDHQSSYTNFEKSVLDLYTSCCPSLPKYQYLSEELRESIAQLEKSYFHTETIKQAFMMAEESDYLKGKGKDGWQADLSWLCKDGNLQKVLEGRYRTYRKEPAHNSFYGCNGPGQAELEAIQKLLRDDDPNFQIPALRS